MKKNDRVWILGAQDPEMREIEKVLLAQGETVVYAMTMISGNVLFRCNSRSAYEATHAGVGFNRLKEKIIHPDHEVMLVEAQFKDCIPAVRIDHHNPGDPGFDKTPDRYMEGSSLGQVLSYLKLEPTETQRLLAAGDHCPTDAYRGLCPGVDPDELFFMRTSWMAKITNQSLYDVITGVERAEKLLKANFDEKLGLSIFNDPTRTPGFLREASAKTGIGILYRGLSSDGRMKEMIKGGNFSQIQQFMDRYQEKNLHVYGNPYRGYAGVYLEDH